MHLHCFTEQSTYPISLESIDSSSILHSIIELLQVTISSWLHASLEFINLKGLKPLETLTVSSQSRTDDQKTPAKRRWSSFKQCCLPPLNRTRSQHATGHGSPLVSTQPVLPVSASQRTRHRRTQRTRHRRTQRTRHRRTHRCRVRCVLRCRVRCVLRCRVRCAVSAVPVVSCPLCPWCRVR